MTWDAYKQIDELLLQLIDGAISDEGFIFLKRWFEDDPEALRYYCRFMSDYATVKTEIIAGFFASKEAVYEEGLDHELWNALAEVEKTAPAIQMEQLACKPAVIGKLPIKKLPKKINKFSLVAAITSLAAFLLLTAYVYLNPRTLPPIVGVLTDAVDARWEGQSGSVSAGQDLRTGVYTLQSGVVGIRLDGGAKVILSGPVDVYLQTANSMYLRHGSLVATVGREAVGFVVNTPYGKVLDLGTEFAVKVTSYGTSDIHVFQGEVLLYPELDQPHVVVSAGNARSIDANGKVETILLRAETFVRADELASHSKALLGSDYHRWKASIYALHRDPSLKAHYFYEQAPSMSTDRLINAAPLTAGRLTGQFGLEGRSAPTWVKGRWDQKAAVRFERGKDQAIQIEPDPALSIHGPVTISTWVYYPDTAHMGGHLVSCRETYHVNFQFSIFDGQYVYENQRNQFEFLRYSDPAEKGCYSRPFFQESGIWYHFAVTHDTKTTRFYVNGTLFETKPYKTQLESMDTELILGAMKLNDRYVLKEGDFDGVVDELMIFSRCLGDSEIREIYEAGCPASE